MRGHRGKDPMTDIGESPSGCGRQGRKKANELKKDEGSSWSRLGRMGMMGKYS
jgi:hypothetical protein